MFFGPSKSGGRAKIWIIDISEASDHIQITIKMPNPSQDPPASSKAPNEDLKDMDVLCTFKIKIESQNSEYRCIKYHQPYPNQDQDAKPQSGTSSPHKSKMPNPSQELPAPTKAPNQDLKDMDVLCTFKIKVESQNLEYKCIKDQ